MRKIVEINGIQIREGTVSFGPNMDWNKFYLVREGQRIAGPFATKREAKIAAERI